MFCKIKVKVKPGRSAGSHEDVLQAPIMKIKNEDVTHGAELYGADGDN